MVKTTIFLSFFLTFYLNANHFHYHLEMLAGKSPFDLTNAPTDQDHEDYLFQVIKNGKIRIPRNVSVKAQRVLTGFLQKDPNERLGCKADGFEEIKGHKFFESIKWEEVIRLH